jgi:hypothetical protein
MLFRTESGSAYILDKESMNWARIKSGESGKIRQEFGQLLNWPRIKVGERAFLQDDKIQPGCAAHFVTTSVVTMILE